MRISEHDMEVCAMEYIASLLGTSPELAFVGVVATFLLLIVITGVLCRISGFNRGQGAERKWFFAHAQILTFSVKDAVTIGGGVVQADRGLFYVAPAAEHLRRAGSLEDAITWARNLNPHSDVSMHLMSPDTCGSVPIVVYLMQQCGTPEVIQDGHRLFGAQPTSTETN